MLGDLQGGSVLIGHLFRIPVFVHVSAVFMLVWAYLWARPPATVSGVEWYIIVLIMLLVGLVLHEVGHAIANRMLGAGHIVIYLTGFGGLCVSGRPVGTVVADMVVVAAGPATNLALAALFWYSPNILLAIDPALLEGQGGRPSLLLLFCLAALHVNWGLFIINIMPIYPLDGGRLVFGTSLLVTRDRLLSRQIALTMAVLGAMAWFCWQTGLFAVVGHGGTLADWMGGIDGFDIVFAIFLVVLVRSAMQQLY